MQRIIKRNEQNKGLIVNSGKTILLKVVKSLSDEIHLKRVTNGKRKWVKPISEKTAFHTEGIVCTGLLIKVWL